MSNGQRTHILLQTCSSDEYCIHIKQFCSSDSLLYLWGQLLQHMNWMVSCGCTWCCARPALLSAFVASVLSVLTFIISHQCTSMLSLFQSLSLELIDSHPWLIHHLIPLLQLDKLSTLIMDLCGCEKESVFLFDIPPSDKAIRKCLFS